MKIRFSVLLSASITLFAIIIFSVLSLVFKQNLYNILVEQAIKDNQVIGESILSLLNQVHEKEDKIENIIPSVQNSCNVLKLPNGGYVCATKPDGSLVAYPNLKKDDIGKNNLNSIFTLSSLNGKNDAQFISNQDDMFKGLAKYNGTNNADIVVKFKHKSGLQILVHQNNNEIMEKADNQGEKILFFGIIASLIIGIITYFLVNFQAKKYEKTIDKQNEKIIEAHNNIQEEHKKTISSITYAQRIQQSIFPLQEEINSFLPNSFFVFKPRDIVSGDFYYLQEKNNKIIFAVADCTGHGVPGALMTMLGNEILNEIILNKDITAPDKILNELHLSIRKTLKQEESDNKDGMDIAIIVIDKTKQEVTYAGAKNPLIYIQNKELTILKANKMAIGGEQEEEQRIFKAETIEISHSFPTMFYLFSDGFQDQFGGENKKKFGIAELKKLLLDNHHLPMSEQQNILTTTIENWMNAGNEKQIDDILLVGIKI